MKVRYLFLCFLFCASTHAYAELFITVKNTIKPSFQTVYVHGNIQDLTIKNCASYTKEQIKNDPSVRMSCAEDPENTLFTHHFIPEEKFVRNGRARVILSFEPGLPGHVRYCASEMITLIKPVEVITLQYPRDFACS